MIKMRINITKKTALLTLALIAMVATVSASLIIWSNLVPVNVIQRPLPPTYTFTLTAPSTAYVGEPIVFTGSLLKDGASVVGATIDICDIRSDFLVIVVTATTTDANGNFMCEWTPDLIYLYHFQARYTAS